MARFTAKKNSYLEYYKDPRWQKKRLEVMQRDRFACRSCCSEDKTLNVHHCYYEDGKMPWEYENSSLMTLCEDCHEYQKDTIKEHRAALLKVIGKYGGAVCKFEQDGKERIFSKYIGLIFLIESAVSQAEEEYAKDDGEPSWRWLKVLVERSGLNG